MHELERKTKILQLEKEINQLYSMESNFDRFDNIKDHYKFQRINKELELSSLYAEYYDNIININEENYTIEIKDSTNNLKKWIKCLEQSISKGQCIDMLKEDINNLENIIKTGPYTNYTFPSNERIYYSKDKITYLPNAHSKEEKERIFNQMKKHLDLTKKLFENNSYKI